MKSRRYLSSVLQSICGLGFAVALSQASFAQTPPDTTAIDSTINSNIYANGTGKISGPTLAFVLTSITAWVATYFSPTISGLPVCASPCTVAPVAAGQPFINSSGFVVIAAP